MIDTNAIYSQVKALTTYAYTCASMPINAPICFDFWMMIACACVITGCAVLIWCASKWLDYRMKLKAAIKAQADRERIADPETMRQYLWAE